MKSIPKLSLFFILLMVALKFDTTSAEPSQHVVISEIQLSGGTGYSTDEFVELYNPTDVDVNLSNWKITKKTATGQEYALTDSFGEKTVRAHSYFLIAHPAGYRGTVQPDTFYTTTNSIADNNTIISYDQNGSAVDKVGFGTASDYEGTALANPSGGRSVERKAQADSTSETMVEGGTHYFFGNSEDTDNNSHDFIGRTNPEPQNSLSEPEYLSITIPETPAPENPQEEDQVTQPNGQPAQENKEPIVYPDTVIIDELFPNPVGSDDGEFIELKNTSNVDVDIVGWKLGDNSKRKYTIRNDDFATTVIKPQGLFAIKKEVSAVSLNNNGDTVKLLQPDDHVLDSVAYLAVEEGKSYSLINGQWVWTDEITPGKENILAIHNESPQAEIDVASEARVGEPIQLDGSSSSDPDGDELSYEWDFGDGQKGEGEEVEHSYQTPGTYTIILRVLDEKDGEDIVSIKITVTDYDYSMMLVISELLPAPDGPDNEHEFIELFNPESRIIHLAGWILTDTKRFYRFPEDTEIKANDYFVVKRHESKITLNDGGDTLYLIDPHKKIINGVQYTKAKPNQSFSRRNGIHWAWTSELTDGKENVFIEEEITESATTETLKELKSTEEELEDGISSASGTQINNEPIPLEISGVSEAYLKKLITVTGDVERTSGNHIYLVDDEGNDLRVYIQKKTGIEKPELSEGVSIKVTGVLDKTQAGLRLLPRVQADIEVLASGSVLGAAVDEQITTIPASDKTDKPKMYLMIAGIAVILILMGILARNYMERKRSSIKS